MKKITKTQFTGRDFGKKTLRAYQIWVCIVSCFLVLLVIELGFFFWYFLQVGKRLETIPELGTDETAQKLETPDRKNNIVIP